MSFPTIQLNEAAAIKATTSGGSFFDGNTEQLVKIVRAEYVKSEAKGTTGIEFDVFNADDQKGYFTLWFMRADGSYVDGFFNKLQSIMAATGATTLTPTQATVNKWDFDAGKALPAQMTVAHELMNKYFTGLFVNEFEVYNSEKKIKTQLYAAFNQKRQTLQEQKDQSAPQAIDAQMERLLGYSKKSESETDAKLANSGGNGGYNNQRTSQPAQQGGTSYQRGAPAQQNNQGNAPTNNHPPLDDDSDIPF